MNRTEDAMTDATNDSTDDPTKATSGAGTGDGSGAGIGDGSAAGTATGTGSGESTGAGADAGSHHPGTGPSLEDDTTRRESWACAGPAELDLSVEFGRLEVTLSDDASRVEVEVRAEPGGTAWEQGLSGLLGRLGEATSRGSIRIGGRDLRLDGLKLDGLGLEQLGLEPNELFGGRLGDKLGEFGGPDLAADAVRACEVAWSEGGRRLVVRSARHLPLRLVPLTVTVRAPAGSRPTLRTGGGDVVVTGRAGDTIVRTGSGDVRLGEVDGTAEVTTGSGRVDSGPVRGRARARTGSGDLTLAALGGPAEVRAGSGSVRLGAVHADLLARSGSGDLSVADADAGRMDLTTGSGDLRVGVHAGVTAELDLSSGSGRVRSELDVSDTAPEGTAAPLVVHGRTGSGDVLITRAVATA
jgi:hypothetical protein